MSMLLHDVFDTLIDASTLAESKRLDLKDFLRDHFKADIDGLSDKEKENRPAPVDRKGAISLSPAAVMTQEDVNAAVDKALAKQKQAFDSVIKDAVAQALAANKPAESAPSGVSTASPTPPTNESA